MPKGETLAATNFVPIGTPETDFPRVSVVYATCGAHHEAQHDAEQLNATLRQEDDRRAAAQQNLDTSKKDMTARKRRHPDEPLQRPSTPRARL